MLKDAPNEGENCSVQSNSIFTPSQTLIKLKLNQPVS